MIVDCHTHIWQSAEQIGLRVGVRPVKPVRSAREQDKSFYSLQATPEQHLSACEPVGAAVVLGFCSRHLNAQIPNDFIADYAAQQPDRIVGFAGVDPMDLPKALEEVHRAKEQLGLKGLVLAPAAQAMHPAHSNAIRIYELAERLGMPVVIHNGPPLAPAAHLECARASLLDEVARTFGGLKILITQLGYPWVEETLLVLAKHENVFAEISGLMHRPWTALQYLHSADELEVMDKLLFGSGFPDSSPTATMEALYSLNQLVQGTNLPAVPRERLRGIVERDGLALLGIEFEAASAQQAETPAQGSADSIAEKANAVSASESESGRS